MRPIQKILAVLLVVLLGLTVYGLIRTTEEPKAVPSAGKNSQAAGDVPLVDQTPLKTALQLAQLVSTQDEVPLSKDALRLANYEVDLAYDAALDQVNNHPPALSPQAKEAEERLQKAQKLLTQDETQIADLQAAIGKTKDAEKKERLDAQLDGAESDRDLAQDEIGAAEEEFRDAGGDVKERLQQAQKEHKDAQRIVTISAPNVSLLPQEPGLIHRYQEWSILHSKQMQLWRAKQAADASAASLAAQHNSLEGQLEAEKEKTPTLAHHSKKTEQPVSAGAGAPTAQTNTEDVEALAEKTWQISSQQEALATYDKRADVQKQLSETYKQWISVVTVQQRTVVHRALMGALVILAIAIFSLYFGTLLDGLLGRLNMDRRQMQTLRTVTRVALRVVALLLILLVVIGPPGQLGTFLGLAGAGLTVALKDFIVGFIGWFVLMGKNGIRLGDWVEINGVTGEVVEIGPIHTVLLETGNWTDSGHPTGRRVTFTNSFAIEGHYFNFSTTGQWLWDELKVVLPLGQDPYPMVEQIKEKVLEATEESAKEAEEEWKRSTRSREMSTFSAAPALNVKPVLGGIELSVRYITRAHERYQLRAKLYQAAVDMLGQRPDRLPSLTPTKPATT